MKNSPVRKIGLKSKKQNFTDVVSTSYVSGCNCDEESVQGRLMKARRESTGLCGEAVSEDFLPRIDPSQACLVLSIDLIHFGTAPQACEDVECA